MKITKITWTCDNCGAEFSRDVESTIVDDGAHVEVLVTLKDFDDEGPLCDSCFAPAAEADSETAK